MRLNKINRLILLIVILFTIISIASLLKRFHIQFNDTPSMPIGFYRLTPTHLIRSGDIVAVCLPKAIARIGLKRGYLVPGHCAGGVIAVLKRVIAVPHDTVTLNNHAIIVNHLSYPAPRQYLDHHQLLVKKWIANGTYQHINTYWLYGSHAPKRSWDSRYYGGVARNHIMGVYKPVLIL